MPVVQCLKTDAVDGADATLAAAPPDDAWRVLNSGDLAYAMPPSKEGKQIWLHALRRIKLCEHGASGAQIHHWHCAKCPREKPEWVTCNCVDAKGLFTNAKTASLLPPVTAVPEYHRVLWRDAEPVLLQPSGVWAVRVPGRPRGQQVCLDRDGTPRCVHGYNSSELNHRRAIDRATRRVNAATKLQAWWRAIRGPRSTASAAPQVEQWRDTAAPTAREWCGCTTAGLRLERFGFEYRQWPSYVRKYGDDTELPAQKKQKRESGELAP